MATIKNENIQISDNGGPKTKTTVAAAAAAAATLIHPLAPMATAMTMTMGTPPLRVRDETSQNEKSVHSQPSQSSNSSGGLRAWFRKSNTCGSLYVKCSCSNEVSSSGSPVSGATPGDGTAKGIGSSRHGQHHHTRPISTSEKDFRKIKVLHAFSHPDTTTVFTDANKYANNIGESPTRALITSAQSGEFEILHSTHSTPHSKRLSTPNFSTDCAAFHPEFVLKKVSPKSNGLSQEGKTPSISIPSSRRPILKKSSKSYPGLSPSGSSVDSIGRSLVHNHSASSSVDEVTEEEELGTHRSSEELASSQDLSYISFSAKTEPPRESFSNSNIRQLSLKYAVISGSTNNDQEVDKPLTKPEDVVSACDVQLQENICNKNSQCCGDSACDSDNSSNPSNSSGSSPQSPPSLLQQLTQVLGSPRSLTTSPPPAVVDLSAQEFFIQSGILGPMGNGSSVLMRKTSKIVPNVDGPVKERVSFE